MVACPRTALLSMSASQHTTGTSVSSCSPVRPPPPLSLLPASSRAVAVLAPRSAQTVPLRPRRAGCAVPEPRGPGRSLVPSGGGSASAGSEDFLAARPRHALAGSMAGTDRRAAAALRPLHGRFFRSLQHRHATFGRCSFRENEIQEVEGCVVGVGFRPLSRPPPSHSAPLRRPLLLRAGARGAAQRGFDFEFDFDFEFEFGLGAVGFRFDTFPLTRRLPNGNSTASRTASRTAHTAIGPSRRSRAVSPDLRRRGFRVFELSHLLGLDERALYPQWIDQTLHGCTIAVPAREGRRVGGDALFSSPLFRFSCLCSFFFLLLSSAVEKRIWRRAWIASDSFRQSRQKVSHDGRARVPSSASRASTARGCVELVCEEEKWESGGGAKRRERTLEKSRNRPSKGEREEREGEGEEEGENASVG